MRHSLRILAIAIAAPLASQTPTAAPTAVDPGRLAAATVQQGFASIAREVFPSVVTVRSYVRSKADGKAVEPAKPGGWIASETEAREYPGYQPLAAGSGFFVAADGDVLTSLHALQRADGTLADLVDVESQDGSRILSEIVGTEPTLNLAIVHCAVFPNWFKPEMKPLKFGDSDAMECGMWTLAFGDPIGPEKFLGIGLLAAKPSRDCYQELLSSAYLQASLTLQPQSYGGPLVNVQGEVVGVLLPLRNAEGTALLSHPGCEFALPSKITSGIYESIRKARSFKSPWFGFSVMSRAEIAAARGVEAFNAMPKPRNGILIENVFTPSPAATAGVQPGDFLVAFDGTQIFAPVDFQRCLYLAGIGKAAKLEFFRAGVTLTKTITIEERPPEAKPK